MKILDIDYKDIKLESRSYAGLEGFDFVLNNEENKGVILATTYVDDLQLASVIDDALRAKYQKEKG